MSRNYQRLYKERSRKNERSHRANVLVELRNERRDDLLQRRRLEPEHSSNPQSNYDINSLQNAIKLCNSENDDDRTKGILTLRSAIYSDMTDCEHIVSTPSFITLILNLLNNTHNEEIQYDAACVLANLAIKYKSIRILLTNENNIKVMFSHLNPTNARICETILLTIANTILDNPSAISFVIKNNIWMICNNIVSSGPPIHIAKNLSYFLLNFTAKSVVKYSVNIQSMPLILTISNYLLKSSDEKIRCNVLWAIANINDTRPENIAFVMESGILNIIKQFLTQPSNFDVLHPSLRCFGNLVTNDDDITQFAINMGVLPIISKYILHEDPVIQKECLWFISNIAAGSNSQMALLFEGELISHIIDRFINGSKPVSREALWVLSNILYTGKPPQIRSLMKLSLINHICEMLAESKDPEIIFLCMETFLFTYDNSGISWGHITNEIELHGGLDALDLLQEHPNRKISDTASYILDQYVVSTTSHFDDFGLEEFKTNNEENSFDF